MVLVDVVDAVEVVSPVGNGLPNEASRDGDVTLDGSSLIGDTLRPLSVPELLLDCVTRARC